MDILGAAVALFLVMDPLGNLPVFLSVLKGVRKERRRRVLMRELLIALVVLQLFVVAGQYVMDLFAFSAEAIGIGGGIVLLLIAIRMIFPGRGGTLGESASGEPFIVPLAIPLVAGPSALALVLLLRQRNPGHGLGLAAAVVAAWLASALVLMASDRIHRWLGRRGLVAMERLMGMLLVILAVQMFLDGLRGYLHG